jgi:hypothetical protein
MNCSTRTLLDEPLSTGRIIERHFCIFAPKGALHDNINIACFDGRKYLHFPTNARLEIIVRRAMSYAHS